MKWEDVDLKSINEDEEYESERGSQMMIKIEKW